MTGIDKIGSMTQTSAVLQNALSKNQESRFADLLRAAQKKSMNMEHISSEQIAKDGKLNGDIKTGFDGAFTSESDKSVAARGAAANSAPVHGAQKKIDKTSKLYEKSLELESFFVKMMVSSMRKTVSSSATPSFAKEMYEDMLYDEYTTALTKNAGFGIADQIYLELSAKSVEI